MDTIDSLKPPRWQRLIDLVQEAGLDVSDWTLSLSPESKKGPADNPKYCYDWAFLGLDRIAVCLWHADLQESGGRICQALNYRHIAETVPKSRTQWRLRARRMDEALRRAWEHKWEVRVIIVDGFRNTTNDETSSVEARILDPSPWFVSSYDYTIGSCIVTRGAAPPRVVDQFVIEEETPPELREVTRRVFPRDPAVRAAVLTRSGENCESCGEAGFLMQDGRRFLETHHIIPLSEGGPDIESNMIAICPNEHREAHHGVSAAQLQQKFTAIVFAKRSKAV